MAKIVLPQWPRDVTGRGQVGNVSGQNVLHLALYDRIDAIFK